MKALNFYSSVYQVNLLTRQKRCTVRLGDKSEKYREGDLVWITYGNAMQPKDKIFTAVLDRVRVKPLAQLTREEIDGEDPTMETPEDVCRFLEEVYDRPVSLEETCTVVFFTEVRT